MTLRNVGVGQTVTVSKITGVGAIKRRIMDMGLTKGTSVYVRKVARQAAETLGIPLTEYLPDYETYGRRAPLVRNSQIIAEADLVLAFWDMSSHGTAHTITECIRRRIPVKVIDLKQLHS